MNDIAGVAYVEARFDKHGKLEGTVNLPAGATDAIVVSHGWNNNDADARTLYRTLFEHFVAVAQPGDLDGRSLAIVGVIWPSKKFDELVAVSGVPDDAGGAASLDAADAASLAALQAKLDRMKDTFVEPEQRLVLEEAKALLPDLEDKASARRAFVDKIRSLLNPAAASGEDASDIFFRDDGNELMKSLKVDEEDLDDEVSGADGSHALALGVGTTANPAASGEAAGLKSVLSGFKAAALNVLNFTTYFEMKTRAGTVGKQGVAKLIDQFAPQVARVHLVGHSFGGRVVAAAAAASTTPKLASLTLLQTAFSHNGFSKSMKGFFRSVVTDGRVKGPILVTHTKNDKAVGVAYPLASRISGETAAAFGDEHDVFGGLGRNGAQQMEQGETSRATLLPAGSAYTLQSGIFLNLESSQFVKDHGDVAGKEIAHVLRRAIVG